MKNKNLLWSLAVVVALVVGIVIGMQVYTNPLEGNIFKDAENGVSFYYPSHWETRNTGEATLLASNFDYLDGLASSSTSTEKEGTLVYSRSVDISVASTEGLQAYYDQVYQDCLTDLEPSNAELGPFCTQTDFSNWTKTTLAGYEAMLSDWTGLPESGEIGKRIIVIVDDKDLLVQLMAVKTGVTDEEMIERAWEQALDTLKIK